MTHRNHNDESNSEDVAQFDRLVDGELSVTERQQLLASLDDRNLWHDGNGWRQCALAFLEAQSWSHQFKQLVAEPTNERATAVLPQTATSNFRTGRWLAVAASLLVAFSLGWLTNSAPNSGQQDPQFATNPQQAAPEHGALPEALADGDVSADAVTLVVRDTSGRNQRLQLPLMEAGDLDDRFAEQFSAALPAKLRDSFRDRGFDLQRRRRFAPMFFEQNEELVPMVVPVDDTTIVPVSRPIY